VMRFFVFMGSCWFCWSAHWKIFFYLLDYFYPRLELGKKLCIVVYLYEFWQLDDGSP